MGKLVNYNFNSQLIRFEDFHPDFLVIIPTHNHPETLEFAVASVLNQTYQNFELVVICDGVFEETKKVTQKYVGSKKIKILDFPKSPRVGEEYRDFAIKHLPSKYVTYLGDDDLFLPNHLLVMKKQLQIYDFTHPLPVYVDKHRSINAFAKTNLNEQKWRTWHMEGPPYKNSISLTGVAHTRDSYLSLIQGWSHTPNDRWSDHFMWCKFLERDDMKFSTTNISTTIKSPHVMFDKQERHNHVSYFYSKLNKKLFPAIWNYRAQKAVKKLK